MRKRTFDIIVIFLIAIVLISLNQFDLFEKSAKFMFIPFLAFYHIGQVTERKFQK
jgi:NADH:ubiquinone oxidoreductase subunit 3 (subunit A)